MAIKVLRGSQVNAQEWFHHQGGLVSEEWSSVGEGKAPDVLPAPPAPLACDTSPSPLPRFRTRPGSATTGPPHRCQRAWSPVTPCPPACPLTLTPPALGPAASPTSWVSLGLAATWARRTWAACLEPRASTRASTATSSTVSQTARRQASRPSA